MRSCLVAGLVLAAAAGCGPADGGITPPPAPSCAPAPRTSTSPSDVLDATKALLSTLDDDQLKALPDAGLPLGHLSDVQRAAVLAVLKAGLSDGGYRRVVAATAADGISRYRVRLTGTPTTGGHWVVEFRGPTLGLNLTVGGTAISASCYDTVGASSS